MSYLMGYSPGDAQFRGDEPKPKPATPPSRGGAVGGKTERQPSHHPDSDGEKKGDAAGEEHDVDETALAAAKDVGLDPAKFAFDPLNPAATPKATDLTALGVSNAAEASGDGQQSSYVAAAEASDAGEGGRASWGATATSEGAEGARARGSLTREA
jgi:RAT1-interacting protein